MPKMNGIQVVDKIRKYIEQINNKERGMRVELKEPVFVFLTAYAST
jgi:CheY-like chemotaxis protein